MEKSAHYFVVGVFVSVALLGIVAFVIWLAGTHDVRHYDPYTIYFTDSVSGLNDGASVQYKGVQVGKVKSIRLAEDRNDLIKVDIEVNEETPVRSSTTATLATLGVTGLVFIQLNTLPGDDKPPSRIEGEDYPIIKGSGSALTKLLEDVPQINKRILDITDRITSLLTTQNVQTFNAILANTQHMTQDLNGVLTPGNVANLSASLKNMSEASDNFNPTLKKLETTATEVEDTAHRLSDLVAKNETNVNHFTGQGLRQISAASSEAATTSRSIRELADKLKQDPSQLVYKPSYRGVEIKK